MDELLVIFMAVAALLVLGLVVHPGFGILGYLLMVVGPIWVTR